WRASSLLSTRIRKANARANVRRAFDLELAVRNELQGAVNKAYAISKLPVSVLGHCVGGALVARALVSPSFDATPLDRVVLTTLGSFFRVGLENWFKGNERVLETAALHPERFAKDWPAISPWAATGLDEYAWPDELEELYDIWKTTPAKHACDNAFCHRVSFMFGMPYNPNLVEAMHAIEPRDAPESLELALPEHGFWGQFGDMPVGLYIEVAQSLRQGWLANVAPKAFTGLRDRLSSMQLTLITGNENQLWHRESIDVMYDWLQRSPRPAQPVVKHVENGFGHQDLFWCEESARRKRMFERFGEALDPDWKAARSKRSSLTSSGSTSSKAAPTR
ncbi:MAG TPA: hypothetical protein VMG12_10570, partial [Polyangiaceae bacterium]|nr:hypothetical protein [Polyangiaceae bacterium]